jgi:molybdopterin-guanine dinucleotide biosynthesis protein B
MAPSDATVIAVAADHPADGAGRPIFDLNEIATIADFVVGRFGLSVRRR